MTGTTRQQLNCPARSPSVPRKRESIRTGTASNSTGECTFARHRRILPRRLALGPSVPRKRESIRTGTASSSTGEGTFTHHRPVLPRRLALGPSVPRKRESIRTGTASNSDGASTFAPHQRFLPRRLARALFCSILLVFLLPSTLAAADGVISGTVVNGTAGGSVPADVAVTLYFLREGEIVEQRTQVIDAEAAYRFSDLPTDPTLGFVLVAAHARVPYNTPELQFAESTEIQAPPIIIYDVSQDASVVRVLTDVLIIAPMEEGSGMLAVIEVVKLANESDRTYLATGVASGGAVMDRVLRFALPPDAQDLTMLSGLNAQNIVQIDRGFGVFMPLPPGEREVAFGYQVPYSGSTLDLTKRTVYPTEQFAVFALEEHGLRFETEQLEIQATPIGDRRYLVGSTDSLAARAEVAVQVQGLPAPSLRVRLQRLVDRVGGSQAGIFGALGVVLVLPLLYAVYRMRGGWRRKAARMPVAPAATPDTGEALLLEIAQLDDDFAAGTIVEDDYRRRRADMKQRLIDHYQERGEEGGDE